MATLEEIQKERSERKARLADQRKTQLAVDLAKLNELELQHGDASVQRVDIARFIPGLPTMVVVKMPSDDAHQRYRDQIRQQGVDPSTAGESMAETCIAYPDKDVYATWRAKVPGVHQLVGARVRQMAEGQEIAEEKK